MAEGERQVVEPLPDLVQGKVGSKVQVSKNETRLVDERIKRILWGRSIVSVKDGNGADLTFILRSLTSHEGNRLDFVYHKELAEALRRGMLMEDELIQLLDGAGLWTGNDDIYLKGLERKEKLLAEKLSQYKFQKTLLKKVEKEMEETKVEREERERFRDSLLMLSAENRAEEIRRRHMIYMSTEDAEERSFWPNIESFLDDYDLVLVFNLAISYYRNNVFSESEMRQVARSGAWRFRWSAAKDGADLFGQPISSWTEAQNAIVYWSQFYDFVFESMDRPPDAVVKDDVACDVWYEDQVKKLARKGDERTNVLGTKKATTNKFHQEQFVMVSPGDVDTVKEVQEMNPIHTRNKLRREQEVVKKSGKVSEWELRKGDYVSGRM